MFFNINLLVQVFSVFIALISLNTYALPNNIRVVSDISYGNDKNQEDVKPFTVK